MNVRMLSTYLKRLGFSPTMKGYQVLLCAILLVIENPNLLNSITRNLYPRLVKIFFTTAASIEKRIRSAIERAWLNADIEFVEDVFQYSIDINKGKPTNRQFITTLAEYIRLAIIFNRKES